MNLTRHLLDYTQKPAAERLLDCDNKILSIHLDILEKQIARLEEEIKAINKPQWIPVSERPPENKAAYYIVTLESCDQICDLPYDIDIARWDYARRKGEDSWHWCKERKVIAWMPLPIPYKEKNEIGGETDD